MWRNSQAIQSSEYVNSNVFFVCIVVCLFRGVWQYVDECRCLTDKADGIHEKVGFVV